MADARRGLSTWLAEATGVLIGGVWVDVVPGTFELIQDPYVAWQTTTGAVLIDRRAITAIRAQERRG